MTRRFNQNASSSGSVFLVLFSAIGIVGLLGASVMSLMKGPLSTSVQLTRTNSAQTQMTMAAQSTIMAASNLASAGDCDADGFVEPLEWRDPAGKPAPTGGGLLPYQIGSANLTDPWGTEYGYCVWDHGTVTLNASCRTTASNLRLAGTNKKQYPVVAVVSAGPDKKFTTTCRTFAAADVNANGSLGDVGDLELASKTVSSDDMIFSYTYQEATGVSGGLWVLKSTDLTTATTNKAIEAPQAKFTGTSTMASIGAPVSTPSDCTGLGTSSYNDSATGHCYWTGTASNVNYAATKAICQASGGYVTTLTSAAENILVSTTFPRGANGPYIGGTDAASEGVWIWEGAEQGIQFWQGIQTGTPVNGAYNNWVAGSEPNSDSINDDCIEFRTDGRWQDEPCTKTYNSYICEKSPPDQALEMGSGLRLPLPADMPTCNSANTGVLRRNASSDGIEMCDGTVWKTMGGGAASISIDHLSDGIANYVRNNIFLGRTPGNEGTIGGGNIFMGSSYYVGSTMTSGSGNTGMGESNMYSITTGSANTAFGKGALDGTTTANRTTAMGDACNNLGNGSANSDNTCIGRYALQGNVTEQTTSAGMFSGSAVTGATRTTWLGGGSGYNNTTGMDNTAVGNGALATNITGGYSTGVGAGALGKMKSTGTNGRNTAIGLFSGGNITTGNQNTAIGAWSLNFLTIGTNNTAVGYNSGLRLSTNAANSNNTVVGYQVMNNAGTVQDNTIVGSYAAGSLAASAANLNVIIGRDAMRDKAGATSQNVVAGSGAFKGTGAAINNVAIGYMALQFGRSPSNVAIGYQSQLIATNATPVNVSVGSGTIAAINGNYGGNTVAGYQAMKNASITINATVIGYEALLDVTTVAASGSTGVGYQALKANQAQNVTAVGYQALAKNTTAATNVAIGYRALLENTIGTNNTAVGAEASLSGTTGTNNTAIGAMAARLSNVTDVYGSYVAVGSQALYSNSSVMYVGNRSTVVGYRAGYATAATDSSANQYAAMVGSRAGEVGGPGYSALLGYMAGNRLSQATGNAVAGYMAAPAAGTSAVTALGALTMPVNVSSSVAAGYRALGSVTATAYSSTAVGAKAAINFRSGNGNTAIGRNALRNVKSGESLVAFGANAGTSVATGIEYSAAIGYNATVSASRTIRLGDTNVTLIEGAVAYAFPSDRRLKKDIHPSDLGLDFIMGLKPVSYRLKQGNGRLDYGFLAQDIEKSLDGRETNMITRLNDEVKTYQLRSNDLIAPIVKAIQERQVKIDDLKRQIEELKTGSVPDCAEDIK